MYLHWSNLNIGKSSRNAIVIYGRQKHVGYCACVHVLKITQTLFEENYKYCQSPYMLKETKLTSASFFTFQVVNYSQPSIRSSCTIHITVLHVLCSTPSFINTIIVYSTISNFHHSMHYDASQTFDAKHMV